LESKGIALIAQIIQNSTNYPEDILMEAASILTTVSTKATMNQTAYGKLGLQLILLLLKQFPVTEYMHELVSVMRNSVAQNGLNNELIFREGADKIIMMFIRDSSLKTVLVNSCAGLATLCQEDQKTTKNVITHKVVSRLVGLLQLDEPELKTNVARVLAAVADAGESGLVEIVKNGGIVPLVKLLSDPAVEVKEQALLTFGKILFAPGTAGPENVKYFFSAQGEKPLLECMFAEEESVQVPALSIVQGLTTTTENRNIYRRADIETKLKKLEKHKNVTKEGSQVANFLKLIKINMNKDARNQRRRKVQQVAVKVEKNMVISNDKDETSIMDQRSVMFMLDCLKKDLPVTIELKPVDPILSADFHAQQTNKLDALLQKCNHRQLRILLTGAIDQGADLAVPIRKYITLNRNTGKVKQERLLGEPYGRSMVKKFLDEDSEEDDSELIPTSPDSVEPTKSGGPPTPCSPSQFDYRSWETKNSRKKCRKWRWRPYKRSQISYC